MKPPRASRRVSHRRLRLTRRKAVEVVRSDALAGFAEDRGSGLAIDRRNPSAANPADGRGRAADALTELGLREPFAGEVCG